jgi:hypothetical protein
MATAGEVQSGWKTVHDFSYNVGSMKVIMQILVTENPPEAWFNLPFVLAYSVLDDALDVLDTTGAIKAAGWMLGARMTAAKSALKWINFALVDDGRNKRNDLAHRATLLPKADCLRYVAAVGAELKNWGLVI